MSQFNVLDQLKRLVQLQEGDTDLYNLKKDLSEKPVLIEQLRTEFESKKNRLNQLQEEFKKVQLERNTLEGDLAKMEEDIKKADGHLSQIKTNKEYTAKIGEIEGLKADKSIVEEKILETFDRADEIKVLVDQEKEAVAKEEDEFNAKKQEIDSEIKELETKVNDMDASREALLEGVDKALLSRYERVLNNKDGLAVVPVVGSNCGGCFMNLPPQMINQIKMAKEIIACEICSRILYIESDIEAYQLSGPAAVKEEAVTDAPQEPAHETAAEDESKNETA